MKTFEKRCTSGMQWNLTDRFVVQYKQSHTQHASW